MTGDCSQAFSQQQALDRHVLAKHGDTNKPTKFYHCTVDGCKYSSTGWKRCKFRRVDHVKEHIKDKGHYGPHSPSDRARRPGKPLAFSVLILARFEQWELDSSSDREPRRTVQSCKFNSSTTKVWHLDVTAEVLLRGREHHPTDLNCTLAWSCTFWNCYFSSRPPENCEGVLFKTEDALQEHRRRAHDEAPIIDFSLISQLQVSGLQNSVIRESSSTELTSSSWRNELPSSFSMASLSMEMESSTSEPIKLGSALLPGSQDLTFLSPYPEFNLSADIPCLAGAPGACCCCQFCQQRSLSDQDLQPNWSWAESLSSELQYQPFETASKSDDSRMLSINHKPSSDTHQSISIAESNTSSLVSRHSQKSQDR